MPYQKYLDKSVLFVKELATELGMAGDEERATRILRAVFKVLRERLTMEESFDLLSQLPMLLKAFYVDGWRPVRTGEKIRHLEEFAEQVARIAETPDDFGNALQTKRAVAAVFRVVKRHVSAGEVRDIESILPPQLGEFWTGA